jgi:hypothetical protein
MPKGFEAEKGPIARENCGAFDLLLLVDERQFEKALC